MVDRIRLFGGFPASAWFMLCGKSVSWESVTMALEIATAQNGAKYSVCIINTSSPQNNGK